MSLVGLDLVMWKEIYMELGYAPIPLQPFRKAPLMGISWKKESIDHLWGNIPEKSNIGLRCGGNSRLLVIDCDEKNIPGTFNNIQNFLSNLGIDNYPVIKTASGVGRHIYLKCQDHPRGSYHVIKPDFGAGEIRFGENCYVVAPPSSISDSANYDLISGDIKYRPLISFNKLQELINCSFDKNTQETQYLEKISRNAKCILFGKIPSQYVSRSEAEQALIVSLINKGLDFKEILELFLRYPAAGKFKEIYIANSNLGINWLRKSYENARLFAYNNISVGRQSAINARNWAQQSVWKGRCGSYNKAVFIAHTDQAYDSGKIQYHASCRTLSEKAGISIGAVSNANKRLIEKGYVLKIKSGVLNYASIFSIGQSCTLPQKIPVRKCISMSSHDVFRYQALGKSGLEIWEALLDGPKSVVELEEITGPCKKTIERKLNFMSSIKDLRTGEIVSMITFDGEKYQAKPDIDLDYVAELIGTKGIGMRKKEQHMIERENHNFQVTQRFNRKTS